MELEEPKKTSIVRPIIYLGVVALVVLFVFSNLSFLSGLINLSNFSQFSQPGLTTQYTTVGNSSIGISEPSNYPTLVAYALGMINQNRTNFGVPNVTLSPIPSGQEHADSMLQSNYFSHWDTQGYKPYMRYSLLNGTGFVDENVAFEVNTGAFLTLQGQEEGISTLQYAMVYNDSACCANGHERNILNATHDRVSIGIAYDASHLYFVEDFENYYVNLDPSHIFNASTAAVTLSGSTLSTINPDSVQIFYDPTPTTLSPATLNSQYQKPYDPGSFVGGVLPPCQILQGCSSFQGAVTVRASTWSVNQNSIDIVFSLAKFVSADGSGVYTVYLTQGNGSGTIYYTSISIFIQA